jgi:GcrA cell cycle regulator
MSAKPQPTWTPARVAELKRHFESGLTCSQIAREIDVTRNAVIGKLSRLGLTRPSDVLVRRQRIPREVTRKSQARVLRKLHKAMAAPAAPVEIEEVNQQPRCSLFELGIRSCRWPIGRPGTEAFGFCGAAPLDGLPYCAGHSRLAYKRTAGGR